MEASAHSGVMEGRHYVTTHSWLYPDTANVTTTTTTITEEAKFLSRPTYLMGQKPWRHSRAAGRAQGDRETQRCAAGAGTSKH